MLSHTQRWYMTPWVDNTLYPEYFWALNDYDYDCVWSSDPGSDMTQVRAAALPCPGAAEAGWWCLTYFSSFPPIFHTVTSVTLSRCGSRVTHDTLANGQTHPEDAIIQTTRAHRAGKHWDLGSCDHCHAPDLSHHTAWQKHAW